MAWNSLGDAYSRNNQLDKAIEAFEHVLNISPPPIFAFQTLEKLSSLFIKLDQVDNAINVYQQELISRPDCVATWSEFASLLNKLGKFDKAI